MGQAYLFPTLPTAHNQHKIALYFTKSNLQLLNIVLQCITTSHSLTPKRSVKQMISIPIPILAPQYALPTSTPFHSDSAIYIHVNTK